MDDPRLKVVIEGDASGVVEAGQQAAQSIKLVTELPAAAQEQLNKLGYGTEQLGEKTEGMNRRLTESRVIYGELNRLVPGLGQEMHALNIMQINPLLGSLVGLAAAFYFVKRSIEETNKALDEQATKAAEPTFIDAINARKEALDHAAGAQQAYIDKLAEIGDKENSVATALKDQLALIAALAAARGENAKAQEALTLAEIAEKEATGQITPGQAIEQRGAARAKAFADEAAAKQKEFQDRTAQQQADLDKAKQAAPGLGSAVTAASAAATAEEARRAGLSDQSKEIAEAQKAVDALVHSAAVKEAADKLLFEIGALAPADRTKAERERQTEIDQAKALVTTLQESQRQFLTTQGPDAAKELQRLKDAQTKAETKDIANQQLISDLQRQLQEERETHAKTAGLAAGTAAAQQQTAATETSTQLAGLFKSDVKRLQDFAQSGLTSAEIGDARAAIQDTIDIFQNHKEVFAELGKMGVTTRQLDQIVREVQSQLANAPQQQLSQ